MKSPHLKNKEIKIMLMKCKLKKMTVHYKKPQSTKEITFEVDVSFFMWMRTIIKLLALF